MQEEQVTTYEFEKIKNPVTHYLQELKNIAAMEPYREFFGEFDKNEYVQGLKQVFDIIYDRVINTDISWFLKQEVEQWYDFNRDFVGLVNTEEISGELEEILVRFNLA
ncbi:MAG: hypothetical protein Q8Q35_02715 [Nanoarchaeota archaeon]|nr:hypothetical protein [Nanoarchaeota archaeon]